jgi:gluconokinase
MSSPSLILALDVGTSSTKTALFMANGRRLIETTAHQSYPLHVTQDGGAELDVAEVECALVRAITATLAARRRDRSLRNRPITAVGMSCFWHGLLGYDAKRGKPTPIYTWADARCQGEADRLRATHEEKKYHARTGCMLRSPYWPAKLRWLRRIGKTSGVTHWMSPADWLYGRLCGAFTTSLSMASGTGLMADGSWDAALLRLAGILTRTLTPISDEPLRVVTGSRAMLPALHRFPELKDARWFPALGDGAASNLGSDAVTPKLAALNMGTSGALRLVSGKPPRQLSPGLFRYQVDAKRYLIGGAVSNVGNLRAWALKTLRLPDDPAAIERALAARQFPHHGLTILPFWTGERAPSWPEAKAGTITGLTYATTSLDLLQALIESTYHRLAQIADELDRSSASHGWDIAVSGGIRKSPEALQRLANVLGRPLRACTEPEASLRGAAITICERMGYPITPLRAGKRYTPNHRAARAYAAVRKTQIALEKILEPERQG